MGKDSKLNFYFIIICNVSILCKGFMEYYIKPNETDTLYRSITIYSPYKYNPTREEEDEDKNNIKIRKLYNHPIHIA